MAVRPEVDGAPRPRRRPLKHVRRWLRFHLARLTLAAVSRAPRRPTLGLFATLGAIAYPLMPGQRRLVNGQIDRVYADRPTSWRRRLARRAFVELGVAAVDVARLTRGRRDELLSIVTVPETGTLTALLRSERGAIAIGGHYGAWELIPSLLAAMGARVTTLVRPVREERLDRLVRRMRLAHGARLVERGDDVRALLKTLASGGVVAIAADQTPRGRRVKGRLLGLPVTLPAGPAALACAARVPLVPVAIRRTGTRHVLLVGEPIEPPTGPPREAAAAMTRRYAEVLGEWIRQEPAQWAWFHERWTDDHDETDPAPRPRARASRRAQRV